jgi:hypothetical protein
MTFFRLHTILFLFIIGLQGFSGAVSQTLYDSQSIQLQWGPADSLYMIGKPVLYRPWFSGAVYPSSSTIPFYSEQLSMFDDELEAVVELEDIITQDFDPSPYGLTEMADLDTNFVATAQLMIAREQPLLFISVNTLRRNPNSDKIEQLISFTRKIYVQTGIPLKDGAPIYTRKSVLSSGSWYKIRVAESGMYRIDYNQLQGMGINPATIDPRTIRIYANGGGILPEPNSLPRHDDLVENPILVVGEEDGVFHPQDYIMFYAEGPTTWTFNPGTGYYRHQTNYYDDYSYLFLTVGSSQGKRIQSAAPLSQTTTVITDFIDYKLHEQELVNLTNTGRIWYGELFDATLSRDFTFDFPHIITGKESWIETAVAGRNFGTAAFLLSIDGQFKQSLNILATFTSGYEYAKGNQTQFAFHPTANTISVNYRFTRSLNTASGWLDYISINSWRHLRYTGTQMAFRNHRSGSDEIFEYQLADANSSVEVYETTDPTQLVRLPATLSGSTLKFKATASTPREFIAIEHNQLLTPEFVGEVENQNLHAIRDIDYLIISHPDFLPQAERLADFHRHYSRLNVVVTTPEKIYNEFSSGSQDITAIRDFCRMLYIDSNPGRKLRLLLLFGDASFDYKDKLSNNTNFVPTFQTLSSLDLAESIATDDYYGFLDTNEGGSQNSLLDIGIGRLPVATLEEATALVDKIVAYTDKSEGVMGPWRNEITIVADDGDGNLHLGHAETISHVIQNNFPEFNLTKIYLDAYPQIATPSGQKAPAVNEAINKKIDQGTLIIHYSGHGGEVGWGDERFLEISDILSWRNRDEPAVFITATCEFSRYDDPTRRSAGEMVLLNPDGGAIAMFTTARATYADPNLRLSRAIFENNIFNKEAGEYPFFGDVIRKSKKNSEKNDQKFVLLGDPALRLTFPHNKVITTHINGQAVGQTADTLKALDQVSIRGFVANEYGKKLSDFNGKLYATIFDKASTITTYGDENPSTTFTMFNKIIYKGLVSVTNGSFELQFMMPKDIAYRFGAGRISYYATDLVTDAKGYYDGIQIGGFSNSTVNDNQGPSIRLFMGDTSFRDGGFTGENPILVALLSDESGINTTGAGIGHDITATISGATERFAILNDYYSASLDKSNEGSIRFPFFNLNPGKHTLVLKVWDILNNSSTAEISFEVIAGEEIKLDFLYNFPNPFTDDTYFVFSHNQSNEMLEVIVEIYDLSGQFMHQFNTQNLSSGIQSTPIHWSGRLQNGSRLPKGLYIYRLIVTNKMGVRAEKFGKMINYR